MAMRARLEAGPGTEAVIDDQKTGARARSRPSEVCGHPAVPGLRPNPIRCPPRQICRARAIGRKVSDKFTVPICRLHHRELHRRGSERAWWGKQGIDPLAIAASLWERTHVVAPVEMDKASNLEKHTNLNGTHLSNGPAVRHQNNETKPIIVPEAG